MQNDAGEFVDLYIPRKCTTSSRIIDAKDHAAIQLPLAKVDPNTGRMTGEKEIINIVGSIRRMGESDDSIVRLCKTLALVPK